MFQEVTRKGTRWRIFWPDVDDLDGAKEAIKVGYIACFVLAGMNATIAVADVTAGVIGAMLFGGLGWSLRRHSRVAAVIASALVALSMIIAIWQTKTPFVGIVTMILFACLLSGVRGTFAYARLARDHRLSSSPGQPDR
jgi:hypothetical protein